MTKLINDKKIKKIINLSIQLSEKSAKEAATLTFMAKPFVQATLPHRDPGNKPEWVRRNGNLALSIQSGYQDNKITGERELIGIPFGTIPRLFLFWLTKECKRFGNKKIELGNSFAEFVKKLGLNYNTGGGCRSDSVRLKDQLNRFLHCIVTIDQHTGTHKSWVNMTIASAGKLWNIREFERLRKPEDLPEGYIILNEDFFNSITQSTVPLDERIIMELRQSPLALDLYAFLVYRGFNAQSTSSSVVLSWEQLHAQCGSDYTHIRDFSKKAKEIIKKILAFSPNLQIEPLRGRLKIRPRLTIIKNPVKNHE